MIDPASQDESVAAIRAFDDAVVGEARVDVVLLDVDDGSTCLRKR